jgi:hypothetical protein
VLTAGDSTFEGGGIHSELSNGLRVINCIINDNNAQSGGGVSVVEGDVTLVNCEVTGNSALLTGGGIQGYEADVTCVNCTISGNTNMLGSYGSALYALAGAISLSSSIVWDNPLSFGAGTPIAAVGATVNVAYSDIEGGLLGVTADPGMLNWLDGNIDVDPMFESAAAQPSGGFPAFPDEQQTPSGDYRLRADSPCIDAGDNTAVPSDVNTDVLGQHRLMDDPNTADTGLGPAPIVDMGAYELQGELPPVPDIRIVMDIRPGSCPNPLNPRSRGLLPIALLGSPELDVAQIDPATLVLWREDEGISVGIRRETLEDVAAPADAEPCDCVETGPDGILDLVVKFSMRDLVPTLGLDQASTDEPVRLMISGQLLDGTVFTTSDCVEIVPKKRPLLSLAARLRLLQQQ